MSAGLVASGGTKGKSLLCLSPHFFIFELKNFNIKSPILFFFNFSIVNYDGVLVPGRAGAWEGGRGNV